MCNHKLTFLVLAMAAIMLFAGCKNLSGGNSSNVKNDRIEQLEISLQKMGQANDALESEVGALRQRNADLKNENDTLRIYKQQYENIEKTFEARFNLINAQMELDEGNGVEFGKGFIRMPEKLLFSAGDASLKTGGKAFLDQLAEEVKKGDWFLSIEGHTDADPISRSKAKWTTGSNFELGAYRALNVLVYLRSKGVPSTKMRCVSYGEFKPIADNNTAKGKVRNRRVEILYSKTAPATPDENPLFIPKDELPKEEPKEGEQPKEGTTEPPKEEPKTNPDDTLK
ncbi:MAG: OmpA family protein [Planctomycetes bacterium]|nr:OmpA family protein [Planctomycetota bacterium]